MDVSAVPIGVATSVGPLPFTDPEMACRFVLDRHPELPAVPSLPQRSRLEKRLSQGAWGIQGLRVADGSVEVDHARLDPEAPFGDPTFEGEPYRTLNTFIGMIADRQGPAKFQLTGPVTLGLTLLEHGVSLDLAFRVARTSVLTRGAALVKHIASIAPNVQPIVFVDEPVLASILEPDFPIGPDEAIDLTSAAMATLQESAVVGVRVSGRADWKLVLQTGPQLLVTSITGGIEAQASALADFLERGGRVVWGSVPTDAPMGPSSDVLWRKLSGHWCDLVRSGCDPSLLRTHALLCPTRGLGYHSASQVEAVYEHTAELAHRLHDQALGIKLTVGA